MQPSTLAKRAFLILFLAIGAFYLFGLGRLPLVGPDEPRYAQVAREMFLRADLITPTLGGQTWFEKPALLYWLMMVAYKLFGISEFSARLGPAICGLLTIPAVWLLGREMERASKGDQVPGIGRWSALSLATSLGMIVFSRGASFDIVVTFTITWSLAFFALYELAISRTNRKLLLAGFYAMIGLSLLAKGLIGLVIPFGVLGLYYLVCRRKPSREVLLSVLWGLPIVLIVASTWYGPVISRHGWSFINEFFVQHHLARYISNKYQHPQPFYFYPAIVVLLTLPWTPFLVDSLLRLRSWNWSNLDLVSALRVFALCWMIFPLLFFSFSGSKLPGYILPVVPPVSILVGERIARLCANKSCSKWPPVATGLIVIMLAIAAISYSSQSGFPTLPMAVLLTLPLLISGLFTIVFSHHRCVAMTLTAVALLLMLAGVLQFVAASRAGRESVRDLLRLADAQGYGEAAVIIPRDRDRSAEFYASGRVVYDAHGEPALVDELPQVIAETRQRGKKILVFVPVEYLEPYKQSPQWRIIGDNGNLALVGTQ
ncbi:MAG TPA: glycosyltransferase family 39 protein [Pyrinomonadaceae bacterium]